MQELSVFGIKEKNRGCDREIELPVYLPLDRRTVISFLSESS